MVHGYFSSNKIGPHRLYYQIAQGLNQLGYTVIRTDLSGMGESDGNIEDIRFSDHITDLLAIIDNVRQRKDLCRTGQIHLLGHCIGCCTVLCVAKASLASVASVTLLSPFIPSQANHIKMLGADNFYTITHNGFGYRKGAYCCNSFIDAAYILTEPPMIDILRTIPTNIIFSEMDEFVDLCESIAWSNSIPLSCQVIANANHNFIGPVVRTELIEYLISLFQQNLHREDMS